MFALTTSLSALCLLCLVPVTFSARILAYYPTPSISHQVVFRPLTNELVKRGHEVTVVTTDPQYLKGQAPANLTEVDVHDLSYRMWGENFLSRPVGRIEDMTDQFAAIFIVMNKIVEYQLQNVEVKKVLDKKNQYDLLIVEAYLRTPLVLSHIFNKIPMIQFSSFGPLLDNYQQIGIPQHELLYPTILRRKLNDLTVWDKIKELFRWYTMVHFYQSYEEVDKAMLTRTLGEKIPTFHELANNIDMIFLNVHPIFEGIRPRPPNVIHVPGLHQKPKKALPNDLKNFLDSSKNGVIYVSFGTNVKPSLLPPEKIKVLVKAMSSVPYDVLWKWDDDVMANKSDNIRLSKWLPQSDLLRHPNIKLFITQGGLQSTDEAIEGGVPLLGIPMLGDQWFNVEQYIHLKIGVRQDLEYLTVEGLIGAVSRVIGDESYRQNVLKLKSVMNDNLQKPLDSAIWWTEYVLRNGGAKHLRSPAANMPWMEFLDIKLILTLFIGLVVCIYAVVIAFNYLFEEIRSRLKLKQQ